MNIPAETDKPRTHSQRQLWESMISAVQSEVEMVDLGLEAGLEGASISKEVTRYLNKFCNTYLFVGV
jgi:hypothetical protein